MSMFSVGDEVEASGVDTDGSELRTVVAVEVTLCPESEPSEGVTSTVQDWCLVVNEVETSDPVIEGMMVPLSLQEKVEPLSASPSASLKLYDATNGSDVRGLAGEMVRLLRLGGVLVEGVSGIEKLAVPAASPALFCCPLAPNTASERVAVPVPAAGAVQSTPHEVSVHVVCVADEPSVMT